LEYWSTGVLEKSESDNSDPLFPRLQYSNTPLYQRVAQPNDIFFWGIGLPA
jgi:hypothetical protein